MTDSELLELQLQVEGGICKLPISEMEQLAEHVGLESREYKGKSKLAMSKVVRAKEHELGKTENKVEYLTELQNFIAGTPPPPPPLEEIDPNKEAEQESLKMKLEYEVLCKQFQEMMESYKEKMEQASVKLEDTKPSTPATTASKPKEAESRLPVLFEADVESPWPTGLEVPETLVTLRGGTSSHIRIQVKNTTDHNITLQKRTMLCMLELVKSVTPMEVRKKENEETSADCSRPANNSSEEGEEVRLQSDTPAMKRCQSEASHPTPDVDLEDLTEDQKIVVATMHISGWCYTPFQSPWMLTTHQYYPPPCYGPLVYSPYMKMMYA